jgi:hypothetical protein
MEEKMADMDQQHAELIEEYRTLRAEILQSLNTQINIQTLWFGIIIPAFTFALLQKQPWACLLVWIFNWYSWRFSLETIFSITRIGTYISVFIEPKAKGLRWETSLAHIDKQSELQSDLQSEVKKRYKYSRILIPHAALSLISILSSIYFLYISAGHHLTKYVWISLLILFFIGNLIYFYRQRNYYGWREERAYWRKVWEAELKRQTENQPK